MAAEQKAAAAQKVAPIGQPASSAQQEPRRFYARPVPAELLVPTPQFRAELRAPSAADWLTSPTQLAVPSETLAVWSQASLDPKIDVGPADRRAPFEQEVAAGKDTSAKARVPLPPRRPALLTSAAQEEAAGQSLAMLPTPDSEESPAAQPAPARPVSAGRRVSAGQAPADIEALILRHAERFEVPANLVRRVAWRESKFDPKQRNGRYWGLMQIRVETARGLGFRGEPAELLDADTNMTYAVAYLANAYRVAGRNEKRAEALYTRGYYYEAKRKGMLGALIKTASADE